MCNALCECLKCPGKVVCCCFNCACKVFMGILFSVVGLIIVIGLIVYFTVFFNKDNGDDNKKAVKNFVETAAPASFRDYFKQ